jgi:HEAT repeat protein
MRTTSFTDRIWLVVAGVLVVLTLISVVQAVAADQSELYEQGRASLNKSDYKAAAKLFADAFEEDQQGDLAGEALYWQAFSLYRQGETRDLKKAAKVLEKHIEDYEEAETMNDASSLLSRVYGELARRGDSHAAREIHETVAQIEHEHAQVAREAKQMERDVKQMEREAKQMEREVVRHSRSARQSVRIHGRTPRVSRHTGDSAKVAALNALMMMDPDKAMPIIEQIVVDAKPENRELRRNVIFILGQIDDEQSETMLIELAEDETDPELQTEVIMWLGQSGSERSLDTVLHIFQSSDDEEVRDAALFSLGQHGGQRAVVALKEVASDPSVDGDTRTNAIFSLTQSDTPDLGGYLMEVYRSTEDRDVLESVIFGLSIIDEAVPTAWFEEIVADEKLDGDLRGQALYSASRQEAFSPQFLLDVYRGSDDGDIKSHVCYALAELDDPAALDALIAIADEETDPDIRDDIIFWIGRQNDDRAAEYLLKIINEE